MSIMIANDEPATCWSSRRTPGRGRFRRASSRSPCFGPARAARCRLTNAVGPVAVGDRRKEQLAGKRRGEPLARYEADVHVQPAHLRQDQRRSDVDRRRARRCVLKCDPRDTERREVHVGHHDVMRRRHRRRATRSPRLSSKISHAAKNEAMSRRRIDRNITVASAKRIPRRGSCGEAAPQTHSRLYGAGTRCRFRPHCRSRWSDRPIPRDQLFAREHAARFAHERRKQVELPRRQVDRRCRRGPRDEYAGRGRDRGTSRFRVIPVADGAAPIADVRPARESRTVWPCNDPHRDRARVPYRRSPPLALTMKIGAWVVRRNSGRSAMPSILGIMTSSKIASGSHSRTSASPLNRQER